MKTSEAFRLTKERLQAASDPVLSDKKTFVCHASDSAGVGSIVIPIIVDLLGSEDPYYSLENWLINEHGKTREEIWLNPSRMQITRHAWVDSLIAHYQSLGD